MDTIIKSLIKTTIVAVLGVTPPTLWAASKASTRFDLVGHISQKIGHSEKGVVLLKDTESNKTLVVRIGQGFKIGTTIYHVVSLTDRGAIISDGDSLLHIGDAYTTKGAPTVVNTSLITASSSRIPKKFRISNKPMNAFKKARLISPSKRGSIQASPQSQQAIIANAEKFRQNEFETDQFGENRLEQAYDNTGFGSLINN